MGGTTPGGLPYPTGTDKVVNGDDSIKALAVAVDTKYGPRKKQYIDAAYTTDANGLFEIPITTTATILGCIVQERATANDANKIPIYVRVWQIDQVLHKLKCRAFQMSPWATLPSAAVEASAIVWTLE